MKIKLLLIFRAHVIFLITKNARASLETRALTYNEYKLKLFQSVGQIFF